MRAFWAAVSFVKGGSGGRDMMASAFGEAANLAPPRDKSMADIVSADH
jgi:hypothetical protein